MSLDKTIVITGASGFLGTWLADEAHAAGYSLVGIDLRAPLRPQIWASFATSSVETVDLQQLLQQYTIHAVFHLAGGASVGASVNDPYGDFYSLLPGTARLALYLTRFQANARFFLFSSAAVYGNPEVMPITEQSLVVPISPYGVHKATAETLLSHYARLYGLQVVILRLFSVYGPGLRKQLIWDITQRTRAAVASGSNNIVLFGTGQESRDFIYVRDVCQAALTILAQPTEQKLELYNVASGSETTIAEVADCLVRNLNTSTQVQFNGAVTPGDPTNWRADNSKLLQKGFIPSYSLDAGLREVATWANNQVM